MTIPSSQIAAVIPPFGASATSGVEIIHTHPVPVPGEGDLLVKLEYSGVCHTDIHSIRGDTPMLTDVAGHEGVGTVIAGEIYLYLLLFSENQSHTNMVLCHIIVGPQLNETQWIGQRVGIRLVFNADSEYIFGLLMD